MKEKAEKILLWGWLLFLPGQLGKHWWPKWSLISGVRVDWLSPTLYFLDLIWLSWFLVTVLVYRPKFLGQKKERKFIYLWMGVVLLNIILALRPEVSIYRWLRLGQVGITGWLLKERKEEVKEILRKIIPYWLLVEGGLALAQVLKGGALLGGWYWLGERAFSTAVPNIAKWSWWGRETVRGYGTFSHPNSLAGFLGIAILVWDSLEKRENKVLRFLVWGMGFLGILATGSRTLWIGLGIIFLGRAWLGKARKREKGKGGNKKKGVFLVLGIVGLAWLAERSNFLEGWDAASLVKRGELLKVGWQIIKQSPIFGVGLGNFVVELGAKGWAGYGWQPVHNIFVLWFAETGGLGVIMAVWFLRKVLSKTGKGNGWIWFLLMFIGMMDHYLLTLPQNLWILVLIMAIL